MTSAQTAGWIVSEAWQQRHRFMNLTFPINLGCESSRRSNNGRNSSNEDATAADEAEASHEAATTRAAAPMRAAAASPNAAERSISKELIATQQIPAKFEE